MSGDAPVGDEGMGEVESADGGGDVPRNEDRRPGLAGEEARMVCVVGTLGDKADVGVVGDVEVDWTDFVEADPSNEFWLTTPGRPDVVDEKLLTDPWRSDNAEPLLARRLLGPLAGVERALDAESGGEEVDEAEEGPSARCVPVPEMVCAAMLSARSFGESSLERVLPIFLDGV
jgi:hypothetical protein